MQTRLIYYMSLEKEKGGPQEMKTIQNKVHLKVKSLDWVCMFSTVLMGFSQPAVICTTRNLKRIGVNSNDYFVNNTIGQKSQITIHKDLVLVYFLCSLFQIRQGMQEELQHQNDRETFFRKLVAGKRKN